MNTIVIELSAEDRARLDRIIELLEDWKPDCSRCVSAAVSMTTAAMRADTPEEVQKLAPAEELPGVPDTAAELPVPEPEEPTVSVEELRAIVLRLLAPNSTKRETAIAIVKEYAAKVTQIPPEKRAETLKRLQALEQEG